MDSVVPSRSQIRPIPVCSNWTFPKQSCSKNANRLRDTFISKMLNRLRAILFSQRVQKNASARKNLLSSFTNLILTHKNTTNTMWFLDQGKRKFTKAI